MSKPKSMNTDDIKNWIDQSIADSAHPIMGLGSFFGRDGCTQEDLFRLEMTTYLLNIIGNFRTMIVSTYDGDFEEKSKKIIKEMKNEMKKK